MFQKPGWWDQNIGDWIDEKIDQWRGNDRGAAQKHFEALREILTNYNLPPGYEMEMYHRTRYGEETNIWVRSTSLQEMTGEKTSEQESDFAKHQDAMNDAFRNNNSESAKDRAERMHQTENHDTEQEAPEAEQGKEQANWHEHERQQAERDQEQEQGHESER